MHHPNQILGAERACGIGATSGSAPIAGEALCAQQQSNDLCRDRVRTISANVEIPACYDFGSALQSLRAGSKITRAGWNGRGQHVELQTPDKHSRMTQPYAVLRNSNGDLVPWVPSQGDLFANDWAILPG